MARVTRMVSRYSFLVDTYATETLKVLSVWSMFEEETLDRRPLDGDRRGRTLREQMVHQCQSENGWFINMFEVVAPDDVLPVEKTKLGFLAHYAAVAEWRRAQLILKDDAWWEASAKFFELEKPRNWIMTRRIAHTAHHRGQQTAMLRMFGQALHSTYGPTADTGGLAKDKPPVVYPYGDVASLLAGESAGGDKHSLPPCVDRSVTELP